MTDDAGTGLYISAGSHDSSILICDALHNDIAEFFHADQATVSQSYETALDLANRVVEFPALHAENAELKAENARLREREAVFVATLQFYADPVAWKKQHDPDNEVYMPDFYSETNFGERAEIALFDTDAALSPTQAPEGGQS